MTELSKPRINSLNSLEQRKNNFIENAKKVHGDKYDYSKVVYKTATDKVEIICKVHGSFFQSPDSHSRGFKCGCPACGKERCRPTTYRRRMSQEDFITQCIKYHGSFYNYDKTVYTGKINQVIITCPIHGDFSQKAENHKNGSGCKKCGVQRAHIKFLSSTNEFVEKSIKVHGSLYDYSKTEYTGKSSPVTIICRTHGDFTLGKASYHYLGHQGGCPKCSLSGTSKQEQELILFIKSLGFNIIENDRTTIKPLELDIAIPEVKIAIEYNGLYWHSEQMGKDKNYHLNKLRQATAAGYRLIQIFEDEWTLKGDIVKARLAHILNKDTQQRLFARKLTAKRISVAQANSFFEKTHIQGKCAAKLAYGLFYNEDLVAAVSFGANRFTKEKELELIRFSTLANVVGGFSKLLALFRRENPGVTSLTSYSDRRWSVGNVYEKSGFTYAGSSQPGYYYSNSQGIRINRVTFQKHKLEKILPIFDPLKTEVENVIANGYTRIFDCGMDKWIMEF